MLERKYRFKIKSREDRCEDMGNQPDIRYPFPFCRVSITLNPWIKDEKTCLIN
jgi:hypothetical protein